MKIATVILLIVTSLLSCKKSSISLNHSNQNKFIALQPLGEYNNENLVNLRDQLSDFFKTPILILKPVNIPETFRSNYDNRYSADSLALFLSNFCNDTIVDVVGLMHEDIYTMHIEKAEMNNKRSVFIIRKKDIFGFGYVDGNSCVVSDYRLTSPDKELLNNRLRKVIIHEIGHNLGLAHCSVDSCIMSESNGNISVLNKIGGDYCNKCRRKLK